MQFTVVSTPISILNVCLLVVHLHVLSFRLVRDPRAGYMQTLSVLEQAKIAVPGMVTKSSIMLGCGETDQQVLQTLKGLYSILLIPYPLVL